MTLIKFKPEDVILNIPESKLDGDFIVFGEMSDAVGLCFHRSLCGKELNVDFRDDTHSYSQPHYWIAPSEDDCEIMILKPRDDFTLTVPKQCITILE